MIPSNHAHLGGGQHQMLHCRNKQIHPCTRESIRGELKRMSDNTVLEN